MELTILAVGVLAVFGIKKIFKGNETPAKREEVMV
jgi:hypothetical protein